MRTVAIFLFLIFSALSEAQEIYTSQGFLCAGLGKGFKYFEIREEGAFPLYAVFDNSLDIKTIDSLVAQGNKVEVSYFKSLPYNYEGIMQYDGVVITKILPSRNTISLSDYKRNGGKIVTLSEPVVAEGFLIKGFEHYTFYEVKNDSVVASGCLFYDDYLGYEKTYLGFGFPEVDCHIKLRGTRVYGPLQYCNRTGSDFAIQVDEIISINHRYNMHDFIVDKIRRFGNYNSKKSSMIVPDDFAVGKQYKFTNKEGYPECTLELTRRDIDLVEYMLSFTKSSKHVKRKSGTIIPLLVNPDYRIVDENKYASSVHKLNSWQAKPEITMEVWHEGGAIAIQFIYYEDDEEKAILFSEPN